MEFPCRIYMEKLELKKYNLKGYSNVLDQKDRTIWFTSDTHFGHKNIIQYCSRPWDNVEKMNEDIINNWNAIVKPNDIVFHLGDVQLGGGNQLMDNIFPRLNGHIILILGNHDNRNLKRRHIDLIDDCFEQLTVNIDGIRCILTHCPVMVPRAIDDNIWNLHGHLHTKNGIVLEDCPVKLESYHYDVGVDNNNYRPISFNEIKNKILNSK